MAQSAQPYQCAQSLGVPKLHFCPLEAEAIGLNEAVVVERLRFWLSRSKHFHEGKPWVYNTYPDWQRQFPFWSVFTVKSIFRRLEKLGVLESTQRFNRSRWNRTKWYTLNDDALAELLGQDAAAEAAEPAAAMGAAVAMERQPAAAIDGTAAAAIDGADFVPCLAVRSTERNPQSAGAREPNGEARALPLAAATEQRPPVNELDAAYAAIPAAERDAWYERADRALAAAGMPGWMRITPTVRAAAVRMWQGELIPSLATG